ncbi:hypothetical protein COOONC_18634 [Cooperia oncophora]
MNPVRWGFEGDTELTSFGKRQSLGLGREMRRFVGDLVNENYLPNQAKYYSSSANRCQMTMQVALAGFYTPTAWADWNKSQFDFWSPVPYTIDDPMLRMYSVKDCPVYVSLTWAKDDMRENHQIRCAEYAPCRNIMGGVWLKNLLDSIRSAIKGEGPSVIGYASVSS